MNDWMLDLAEIAGNEQCEHELFSRIASAASALNFEYCAYGFRAPLPLSNPKITLLSNYPQEWRERYIAKNYHLIDPSVHHARQSQVPIVWTERLFANSELFWDEAQSYGLRFGWAQSCCDSFGIGGMLSLARSSEPIKPTELEANEQKMRWLVHIAHFLLAQTLNSKRHDISFRLTTREQEVLRWTADGKSSQEIADILTISKNTIEFHIKNAITKLHVPNKTAATVRAAMLGYLG